MPRARLPVGLLRAASRAAGRVRAGRFVWPARLADPAIREAARYVKLDKPHEAEHRGRDRPTGCWLWFVRRGADMATGTCATCGQDDIPLVRRKWLRDHLMNPTDPMSARCLGRTPASPPPPRLPDVPDRSKRKKPPRLSDPLLNPPRLSDPRLSKRKTTARSAASEQSSSVRTVSGGGFESNRRKH